MARNERDDLNPNGGKAASESAREIACDEWYEE
jgi:hypothetical protein